jgi:hypothetical protein
MAWAADVGRCMRSVRHVYALRPLTQEVVSSLNAELTLEDLAQDLTAARYPSVTG